MQHALLPLRVHRIGPDFSLRRVSTKVHYGFKAFVPRAGLHATDLCAEKFLMLYMRVEKNTCKIKYD